jgi:hypothetical protein
MKIALLGFAMMLISISAYADDNQQKQQDKPEQEVKLDMVSDTVGQVFDKANAILSGNLEVTMSPKVDKRDDYTINAMGQRVPTKTAIKSGGALHNDEPL